MTCMSFGQPEVYIRRYENFILRNLHPCGCLLGGKCGANNRC